MIHLHKRMTRLDKSIISNVCKRKREIGMEVNGLHLIQNLVAFIEKKDKKNTKYILSH